MIQDYRRGTYYLLFGIAFSILWFLFKLGGIPNIMQAMASTSIDVAVCLFSLLIAVEYLLPKYIYQNKYALFFTSFFLLVFFAGSIIILSQLALMGSSLFAYKKMVEKYRDHYIYWFWSDLIFGSYFLVTFIAMAGCAIRLAFDRLTAGRKIEELEKEKIQAELIILKDQINPHFLFNALNTVYYQIERSNLTARNTLEQFSSLLRYQLYECNQAEVAIENEIGFLSSYIHIQSQRFKGTCAVTCHGLDQIKGFSIAPYLLAPLIENCFKHVSRLEGSASFIDITCSHENRWFCLETTNSMTKNDGGSPEGIGLNNVRKRLALSYTPEQYSLAYEEKGNIFSLMLKLKI